MMSKPRGRNPIQDDRRIRHQDVLAQVSYDRVGAEMRGLAEAMATYFETLHEQCFTRDEAFTLVRDFAADYWEAQNAASMGD
jgi:hypothetical protein